MRLVKKRINNIDKYINHLAVNSIIYIWVPIEENREKIETLWFRKWEAILPQQTLWKASEYNAEGRTIIRKDLEKEDYVLELPWSLQDWWGNWHYWISYIDKLRYPRDFIKPYEVYLHFGEQDWKECIISDALICNAHENDKIKNTINMFLEIFGTCYIFNENFRFHDEIKVDWKIFPQWEYPWERMKDYLNSRILWWKNKKWLYTHRIEELYNYNPSINIVWQWWYDGYIILWYPKRDIFIAECCKYWNATYIMLNSREEISKMTKAEIINGDLAAHRVIHWLHRSERISKIMDLYPEKE